MIFSSAPDSSLILSAPVDRTAMAEPGVTGRASPTATLHVSPSSDKVSGNEAIVAGVAHRRAAEPVIDEYARRLVYLVLDRLAADRHFDDYVHLVRWVTADG
jgi:hypothetical protein